MRPVVELVRLEEDFNEGTFGVLRIQKRVFCVTLEPRDEENKRERSSIPAQQYEVMRYISPKYGETFQVLDVPDRDYILFHPGNVSEHTQGCIILAQYFGKLGRKRAVLNSGNTFSQFMAHMDNIDLFHLTVMEQY